jgi:hypothetical protein
MRGPLKPTVRQGEDAIILIGVSGDPLKAHILGVTSQESATVKPATETLGKNCRRPA